MPLFKGKDSKKDRGDAFEEAKLELTQAQEELLQASQQLTGMDEWRTFAEVRRHRLDWDRDQTEKFADALVAYDKALRKLFDAFNKLKRELPV